MTFTQHHRAALVVIVAVAVWSWFGDAPQWVAWTWPVLALTWVAVGVVHDRRDAHGDGAD